LPIAPSVQGCFDVDVPASKKDPIKEADLRGFKYFKKLSELLGCLHQAACQRDRAGNRLLHMDQYMSLLLLRMFTPICDSLRAMQQASSLGKVQKKLAVPRASLGSLSEAARVFDSDLLVKIVGNLAGQLKPIPHSAKLDDLGSVITAVDSTLLKRLPKTVHALWIDEDHKAFKAHVHYEVLKGVAVRATLTSANTSEMSVLRKQIEPGRLYVLDRGFTNYSLMGEIISADSSFVCRIQDNCRYQVQQESELDREALELGIVRDAIVCLGSHVTNKAIRHIPLRVIQLECREHTAKSVRARREGRNTGETMLLATNRLDLPADVIAVIYKHRWEVEIFFRYFKHMLGCRHLLSHCRNGIELQTYAAIIACLLIALYTGRKPTKRTYEMFCWYLMGWAEREEVEAHIEGLKTQK
jgi:hypothetical protein